ncbi:hypothetical protein ACSBR1_017407 [Camellia fascicularis]
MASSTVVQRGVDMFKDKSVEKIILVGASGVGKTWTAKQLSKHAIKEGLFEIALWWEAEDSNKGEEEDENHEDLQTMIAKSLDKKKVFLILDDKGNKMKEGQIMPELETLLNLPNPLSVEESLSLFQDRVRRRVYEDPVIKDLAEKFIKETKYFPATIMLMAKAFSYFVQCDSGTQMVESALKEASESDSKNCNLAWLLHNGYDMLPKSVLIYCCRHGSHFFRDRESIYYSELIAYWILERYLGHVDCMEKAYEKGHFVFMELVDCQLLKKLDSGNVVMDSDRAICKEFHEQSQKLPSGLKILDTSQTPLEKLPFEINAHHLFIKHCLQLQKLPCIEALKDLEVLDLSGTSSLVEIEDQFFSHLSFLEILNLSKTGIKTLPSVSKLKTCVSYYCRAVLL